MRRGSRKVGRFESGKVPGETKRAKDQETRRQPEVGFAAAG
jgi:hypothetical protein